MRVTTMRILSQTACCSALLLLSATAASAQNIVLSNDDGWATAQIRAQFSALEAAGFDVILSCPAENQSGTGSLSVPPIILLEPCEFNTCPAGSPPEGSDASNPRLNYVNAFPVDAVRYGIQTLSPQLLGAAPDFVVSGPNIGSNLGLSVLGSGTVGAASEAALEGIPSAAFSGVSGSQVSYTTLTSMPTANSTLAANIYATLTAKFTSALLSGGPPPILPAGITLNVNYASIANCPSAESFQWVFTRIFPNPFATDIEICGSSHLPDETTVVNSGCFASVSVINASLKLDVGAAIQQAVLARLGALPFTCL